MSWHATNPKKKQNYSIQSKSHVNYSLKINSSSFEIALQIARLATTAGSEKKKKRNNYNHVFDMIATKVWYMSATCVRVCVCWFLLDLCNVIIKCQLNKQSHKQQVIYIIEALITFWPFQKSWINNNNNDNEREKKMRT